MRGKAVAIGMAAGGTLGLLMVACDPAHKKESAATKSSAEQSLAGLMFDACGRWNPNEPRPVLPGPAPLIAGLGDHHFKVTTSVPAAQEYFDQGLRLLYGFNHCEAERSFLEAGRRDPTCAMAFWGVAMSLGTNYNVPAAEARNRSAYQAIQTALSLEANTTPIERALINATAARFTNPPPATSEAQLAVDTAYSRGMAKAAAEFPKSPDVLTLYAESMMNLRPWDLWTKDGEPQPGTLEIVGTLERAMALDENHPGANHLYIHAVEASTQPEKAVASADRLRTLMPAAGHLVHMPSHTYIRVGRYADAAETNRKAIAADQAYLKLAAPEGVYKALVTHNYEFLWSALLMEGRKGEALATAKLSATNIDPVLLTLLPGMDSSLVAVPITYLRFSDWDAALREPPPPENQPFASAMSHYIRAVAAARLGKISRAERELAQLVKEADALKNEPKGALRFNPDGPILQVAVLAAQGEIALARGSFEDGIRLLKKAVVAEDALAYSEPPDWAFPVRHRLAEALLAQDLAMQAEQVYREDLELHPNNGWALHGLASSLRAQGRTDEAERVQRQFETAWARADVTLASSAR